ncbi:hypothetical protein KIN20_028189 [Parelaphostrongylus tenuis]|uniref:Uncharacterized protein n=1 Tax=Parelaphostrongylus tenuis TaxID=148309 RepID=A0AAD5R0M6_PARTN|nr:hypothetical protein KIN20_028189 [Parelaphostrongylus tenuis]
MPHKVQHALRTDPHYSKRGPRSRSLGGEIGNTVVGEICFYISVQNLKFNETVVRSEKWITSIRSLCNVPAPKRSRYCELRKLISISRIWKQRASEHEKNRTKHKVGASVSLPEHADAPQSEPIQTLSTRLAMPDIQKKALEAKTTSDPQKVERSIG